MLEFTELLRATHPSHMFVETVCMPRCLLLCACGHGSDWNTWFQLFGWVSEYFWQYRYGIKLKRSLYVDDLLLYLSNLSVSVPAAVDTQDFLKSEIFPINTAELNCPLHNLAFKAVRHSLTYLGVQVFHNYAGPFQANFVSLQAGTQEDCESLQLCPQYFSWVPQPTQGYTSRFSPQTYDEPISVLFSQIPSLRLKPKLFGQRIWGWR